MQRIERYGVIALVLLLVTIAAVSFWEEDIADAANGGTAEVAALSRNRTGTTPRDADRQLPATADPSAEARAREERARRQQKKRQLQEQRRKVLEAQKQAQLEAAEQAGGATELPFPEELSNTDARKQAGTQPRNQGSALAQREPAPREDPPKQKMHITPSKEEVKQKKAKAGGGFYRVKPGETLGEIAYKTLGSSKRWREIAALNGGSETIYEGQKLRLPVEGAAQAGGGAIDTPSVAKNTPKAKLNKASGNGSTYVVKKGDMLSVIAQDELGSAKRWREIAALNPSVNPDRLLEGTRLVMPGGKSTSSSRVALNSSKSTPKSSASSTRGKVR
jgi:LysM repeat protein